METILREYWNDNLLKLQEEFKIMLLPVIVKSMEFTASPEELLALSRL